MKCGRGICNECKREIGEKTYCQICADVYSQLQPDKIYADSSAISNEVKAPQQPAVNSAKAAKGKTVSNILISIGVVGSIISVILFFKSLSITGAEGGVLFLVLVMPIAFVSSIFLIIGIAFRFTKSTAALIYGIFGLTGGLCSILAIAFGVMSLSESRQNISTKGNKASIAGIILGIIGIVVWILWYFFKWRFI